MKKKRVSRSLIKKLCAFVVIQLFLTLFSWPLLVAWQMPIAPLSLLGNIIFVPFLVVFLLLASLLFFTQLCCVPNIWVAYCLNKVTDWWLAVLSLPSSTNLITVPCQSYWAPIVIFVVSMLIIHTKFFWKHDMVWVLMFLTIVFLYGVSIVMIH